MQINDGKWGGFGGLYAIAWFLATSALWPHFGPLAIVHGAIVAAGCFAILGAAAVFWLWVFRIGRLLAGHDDWRDWDG